MHPFDLPEITDLIALFLPPTSLVRSCLVSRHWHACFHPALWRSVSLREDCEPTSAAIAGLARRASLVRVLSLEYLSDDDFLRACSLHYPSLQSIKAVLHKNPSRKLVLAFKDFIDRHGHLLVSVQYWQDKDQASAYANTDVFQILDGCIKAGKQQTDAKNTQRLKSLSLRGLSLDLDSIDKETKALLRSLDSFSISAAFLVKFYFMSSADMGSEPDRFSWRLGGDKGSPQEPCRIQHLTLDSACLEAEYQLALECQDLRSLCWKRPPPQLPGPRAPLDLDLARHQWPHLQRLCLPHSFLTDDKLATILRHLGMGWKLGKRAPLKELDASFTGFKTLCAQVLLDELTPVVGVHKNQSTSRDLAKAGQLTPPPSQGPFQSLPCTGFALENLFLFASHCSGAYIQRFLCEIPTLKRFSGSILTDTDIAADPRPWICHGLEKLDLGFIRTFSKTPYIPKPGHGFTAGPLINLAQSGGATNARGFTAGPMLSPTNSNTAVTNSHRFSARPVLGQASPVITNSDSFTAGPIVNLATSSNTDATTPPVAVGPRTLELSNNSKWFHFPQSFILDRIAGLTSMEELIMNARISAEIME